LEDFQQIVHDYLVVVVAIAVFVYAVDDQRQRA
jgi:hypothetical protein